MYRRPCLHQIGEEHLPHGIESAAITIWSARRSETITRRDVSRGKRPVDEPGVEDHSPEPDKSRDQERSRDGRLPRLQRAEPREREKRRKRSDDVAGVDGQSLHGPEEDPVGHGRGGRKPSTPASPDGDVASRATQPRQRAVYANESQPDTRTSRAPAAEKMATFRRRPTTSSNSGRHEPELA